jgi:hypothetical protein
LKKFTKLLETKVFKKSINISPKILKAKLLAKLFAKTFENKQFDKNRSKIWRKSFS